MINLDHTINILTGGFCTVDSFWNKKHSEIDNCFKIYYITKGEACLIDIEGNEFILQENKVYLINGFRLGAQQCQSFTSYWLHFIPKDLFLHHALALMPVIIESNLDLTVLEKTFKQINLLVNNKIDDYCDYCEISLWFQAFIYSLILGSFEKYPLRNLSPTSLFKRIQPAISYIKEHFMESVNLDQVARTCCMSPNYFHKIFTQNLHITPANYILSLRMNEATSLLSNSELNIKQISYKLGFCNDAHFLRSFKKYFGITPGEYRKKKTTYLF